MKKIIFLLAIVTLAVYYNSLGHSFVWDDRFTILNNDLITHVKYIPRLFTTDIFHSHAEKFACGHSNYYRPLQALTFMADYHIWRFNPFGFHLTNVLLHFANGVLVFMAAFLICRSRITSMFASLLFLVHPVQTGAVNYLTGRSDILACLFVLLSFIFYIGHCSYASGGRSGAGTDPVSVHNFMAEKNMVFYPLSVFFFVAALLSKEAVIIYPLILVLYDVIYGRRVNPDRGLNRPLIRLKRYSAFFLVDAVYVASRLSFLNFTPEGRILRDVPDMVTHFLTMCPVLMEYLVILIFPVRLHMEREVPLAGSFFEAYTALSVAGVIIFIFLTTLAYKRSRAVFFGILWFIVFLLPFSNIVPISAPIAEHWLYIPSIGFFLAAGVMFIKLQSSRLGPKPAIALFVALLCAFFFRTVIRNREWKDDISIYSATLKTSSKPAKMYYNLGTAYEEKGDLDKALYFYRRAVDIGWEKSEVYANIGIVHLRMNDPEKAEENLEKALKLDPENPFAHNGLAWIYEEKGDPDAAINEYLKAIESHPKFYEAHTNLGILYDKKGRYKEAIYHFTEALSIRENRSSYQNLGRAYHNAGHPEKAADIWEKGGIRGN